MNNEIDPNNLDVTLAPIIANALKQHIKAQQDDSFASYPDAFNNVHEWLEVLNQMLYAFEHYEEPCVTQYDTKIEWREGSTEVSVDEKEWARYKVDLEEHEERVTKGLTLFARWYGSLWV